MFHRRVQDRNPRSRNTAIFQIPRILPQRANRHSVVQGVFISLLPSILARHNRRRFDQTFSNLAGDGFTPPITAWSRISTYNRRNRSSVLPRVSTTRTEQAKESGTARGDGDSVEARQSCTCSNGNTSKESDVNSNVYSTFHLHVFLPERRYRARTAVPSRTYTSDERCQWG